MNAAQAAGGNTRPPVLYLDCRGHDMTSPQAFANTIKELVTEDASFIEWLKENVPNLVPMASIIKYSPWLPSSSI